MGNEFKFAGRGVVDRVERFAAKSGKEIVTIVFAVDGRFSQLVPIKVFGRLAEQAAGFKPGMVLDVTGQLGGRDWNGKVYGDNVARSIDVVGGNDEKSSGPPPADDSAPPF